MINYYKTVNGRIEELKNYEEGCWVNCVAPDEEEVDYLLDFFDIPPELLRSALDEEESAHIDSEDDTTLIIIDVPVVASILLNNFFRIPYSVTCSQVGYQLALGLLVDN